MSNYMEPVKEVIAKKIAGEVVVSDNPGERIKKWRNILNISQHRLAEVVNISPSVISDYENGRRGSPGVVLIRKLIMGMVNIFDVESNVLQSFNQVDNECIMSIKEFVRPLAFNKFSKKLGGKTVVEGNKKINGYTVIDSLKAIIEFSPAQLLGIYGLNPDRALVFTDVFTGRSPMIAIKISRIKPSVVVLQTRNLDDVAKRVAEIEKIPLIITNLKTDALVSKLKSMG